jgi:hypothetical protein
MAAMKQANLLGDRDLKDGEFIWWIPFGYCERTNADRMQKRGKKILLVL